MQRLSLYAEKDNHPSSIVISDFQLIDLSVILKGLLCIFFKILTNIS